MAKGKRKAVTVYKFIDKVRKKSKNYHLKAKFDSI